MKKKILKILSTLLIGCSLFAVPASAYQTGWVSLNHLNETEWEYYENNIAINGWKYINNNWYYFDLFNKTAVKGLQTIDGQDYYFDPVNCDMKHDQYVRIGNGRHAAMAWACTDGHIDYTNTTFQDYV